MQEQHAAEVPAEEPSKAAPKVLVRPPPGAEARVTGPGGSVIQADTSWPKANEAPQQQQEQEQQPPRVSGFAARSEQPQVQHQPGAVLTGLSTEAARQASLASSIEESTVYGRTKVIIRVPKGWWAKKGNELQLGNGCRRFVGDALGQGCQVRAGLLLHDSSARHASLTRPSRPLQTQHAPGSSPTCMQWLHLPCKALRAMYLQAACMRPAGRRVQPGGRGWEGGPARGAEGGAPLCPHDESQARVGDRAAGACCMHFRLCCRPSASTSKLLQAT